MRFLGYLVFAVLALLAVTVGAAYLLPREVTVAREIVIDAPPDRIFPYLNSLHKAKEWSPWTGLDPKAKIEVNYAGPDSGVGSRMTWSSDDPRIGTGSQEIMASVPGQRVETALSFDDMGVSTSWQVLKAEGERHPRHLGAAGRYRDVAGRPLPGADDRPLGRAGVREGAREAQGDGGDGAGGDFGVEPEPGNARTRNAEGQPARGAEPVLDA